MKKQNEVRYIVTDVVSIPVFRLASKTEAYRQAVKPGWGTVEYQHKQEVAEVAAQAAATAG